MDKLTLAHEYALKIIETHKDMFPAAKCVSSYAFDYAEAMLAENEKRKDKSRPVVFDELDSLEEIGEFKIDWDVIENKWSYFAIDSNGKAHLYNGVPEISGIEWVMGKGCNDYAECRSIIGYKGNWKDSLRERPKGSDIEK